MARNSAQADGQSDKIYSRYFVHIPRVPDQQCERFLRIDRKIINCARVSMKCDSNKKIVCTLTIPKTLNVRLDVCMMSEYSENSKANAMPAPIKAVEMKVTLS